MSLLCRRSGLRRFLNAGGSHWPISLRQVQNDSREPVLLKPLQLLLSLRALGKTTDANANAAASSFSHGHGMAPPLQRFRPTPRLNLVSE
jgi:hypothetical protein